MAGELNLVDDEGPPGGRAEVRVAVETLSLSLRVGRHTRVDVASRGAPGTPGKLAIAGTMTALGGSFACTLMATGLLLGGADQWLVAVPVLADLVFVVAAVLCVVRRSAAGEVDGDDGR